MTRDQLIEALLNLVPPHERDAVNAPTSRPVYEACMHGLAAISQRRERRMQASYLLPHSLQTNPPASFESAATLALTIERTGSLDLALYVPPGKMQFEGPSGRLYANLEPIEYAKRDESSVREVMFACVATGEVGNLDFLVNDDVNVPKGLPAGWFRSEHLTLVDLSRGRGNTGASIVDLEGRTAVKDSGRPATFEFDDAELYVEILFSALPANIGKLYRILAHRWPGIEEPVGSNIRPTYAMLDDHEVREQWVSVQLDDGGVFTDYTAPANNQTVGDFPLLPAVPVVNDAMYFGALWPVQKLGLRIATGIDAEYSLVWEIWDGVAWVTPTTFVDETADLRAAGTRSVMLGSVESQVAVAVNGVTAYWVRARVSAFTSVTTPPVGSYSYPLCFEPLDLEDGTVEWSVRDWKDLGFVLTSARHVTLGRDGDLELLGDARGMHPEKNESQEAFRARVAKLPDVGTPAALLRVVNSILAPQRHTGRVVDTGDAVLGFFWDEDFFDYYQDGDAYPKNPWKLLLSIEEAYGFFFVQVPWIGEGDFGMFFDAGPSLYEAKSGLYLGSAWDCGFFDGYSPVAQDQVYKIIHQEMDRRKAAGHRFALLPDASLNTP